MANKYILALDQGTTSCRTVIINKQGEIISIAQKEFNQIFPNPGWVEHDPIEILNTQLSTLNQALSKAGLSQKDISAIGITNQRETTVVWDKNTGIPVYNAIVWQDNRTAKSCEKLKSLDLADHVKLTTGLVIDTYFSATKIQWILDNVEGVRTRAENGDLLFGTIDTWLLWHLTKGKIHATDYSNASRTMLYDIKNLCWDEKLLNALDIPKGMMPVVQDSSSHFGDYKTDFGTTPITSMIGDQQAALFGQACFDKGDAKNTYGTGCFMLMNTGKELQYSESGLLTTIAWGLDNEIHYALEGSVFIAGSAIQWLRDGLELIKSAEESEEYALKIKEDNPVVVVPAFAGLGAPYWDMYARGAIFGLTRDTGKAHLIQATLQSLAFQTKDILEAMQKDSKVKLKTLKVDGGASQNNYLMQFQSDILNCIVDRPKTIETTVMGAAYLAGIYTGFWSKEDISNHHQNNKIFSPNMDKEKINLLYNRWLKAVERSKGWEED